MIRRALFAANAKTGPELTQGKHDCQKIYSILSDQRFGGHERNLSAPILQDCATEEDFVYHITKFFKQSSTADQRIVYFTGHGRVKSGQYGFVFNGGNDFIPFSALIALLQAKGAGKTIFILDTCHSGAADLGGLKSDDAIQLPASTGSSVISSSKDIELSHEDPELGSLFTHFLCECISTGNGGRPTSGGLITIADAALYVGQRLAEAAERGAGVQTPRYSIKHEEGVSWIAKNISGSMPAGKTSNTSSTDPDRLRFASAGATIEDLDEGLLKRYADSCLGPGDRTLIDVIRELDLSASSGSTQPNDAATLCFGRRPGKYFPEASSMFSQGDKTLGSLVSESVEGPLIRQFETLVRLTLSHLRTISSFQDVALREDDYEIPADVVREVISNAIAHRDFFALGRVQVHVDEKHVEVTNPGRFPEGHSWQSLLADPGPSLAPNRRVANHLQRLGGYEGLGRGFSILRKYRDSRGDEALTFTQIGDIVRCRLLRPALKARLPNVDVAGESLDAKLVRYVESRNAALVQTPGFLGQSVFKRFVEPSISAASGEPIEYIQFLRLCSDPGKAILVTGSPGVGKTWLLQKCALDLTSASPRDPITLQLYVPLREFRSDLPLLLSVARATGLESDAIEYALQKHNLVLLFDGMDEIVSDRERLAFLNRLAELEKKYKDISVVVSTRPLEQSIPPRFLTIRLNEWSSDRALAFIRQNAPARLTHDAELLLKHDPDFFRSPIMLTLFVQVASDGHVVPSSPEELYDAVVDMMMFRHDETKPGYRRESALPAADMRRLLGVVALLALINHEVWIKRDEFEKIVDRAIEAGEQGHRIHAKTIVREWASRGLIMAERDNVHFIHASLQEHLAAQGAASLNPDPEAFAGVLVRIMRTRSDANLAAKLAKEWMRSAGQGDRLMAALRLARESEDMSSVEAIDEASRLIAEQVSRRAIQDRENAHFLGAP